MSALHPVDVDSISTLSHTEKFSSGSFTKEMIVWKTRRQVCFTQKKRFRDFFQGSKGYPSLFLLVTPLALTLASFSEKDNNVDSCK